MGRLSVADGGASCGKCGECPPVWEVQARRDEQRHGAAHRLRPPRLLWRPRLQEENPSREHTIVRTAQKLKPFSFNKFSANGYHDFLPSQLRPKFQNVDSDESTFSEVLCLICGSPFSESELQNLESTKHKTQKKNDLYTAHCCQSCHFQILPSGTNLHEHFFSLLPKFWTERVDTASASHSSL